MVSFIASFFPIQDAIQDPILHLFIYLFIIYLFFKGQVFYLFIYLAALGLRCCAQAFSSCVERGLLFLAVRRLLIAVASLFAEHRL